MLDLGVNLDLQGYRLIVEQEGDNFAWWVRFRFGRGEWMRHSGKAPSSLQCHNAAMVFLAACIRQAEPHIPADI